MLTAKRRKYRERLYRACLHADAQLLSGCRSSRSMTLPLNVVVLNDERQPCAGEKVLRVLQFVRSKEDMDIVLADVPEVDLSDIYIYIYICIYIYIYIYNIYVYIRMLIIIGTRWTTCFDDGDNERRSDSRYAFAIKYKRRLPNKPRHPLEVASEGFGDRSSLDTARRLGS